MKRLHLYICVLLIFPLFTAFSQAAQIPGADCSHCNKLYAAQADCCTVPAAAVAQAAQGCEKTERTDKTCPHGGFCQASEAIPVVAASITVPEFVALAAFSAQIVFNSQRAVEGKYSSMPPPQQGSSPQYLINCTFLI